MDRHRAAERLILWAVDLRAARIRDACIDSAPFFFTVGRELEVERRLLMAAPGTSIRWQSKSQRLRLRTPLLQVRRWSVLAAAADLIYGWDYREA